MEVGAFTCSICSETSQDICVYCTKDACKNHICERCQRCSDCCLCEQHLADYDSFVRMPSNGNGHGGHVLVHHGAPHLPAASALAIEEQETYHETAPEKVDEEIDPEIGNNAP